MLSISHSLQKLVKQHQKSRFFENMQKCHEIKDLWKRCKTTPISQILQKPAKNP